MPEEFKAIEVVPAPADSAALGGRFIPHSGSLDEQAAHWQPYQFFRPWYEGRKLLDIGCGTGYGTGYASTVARCAVGLDDHLPSIQAARLREVNAQFFDQEPETANWLEFDVVFCFDAMKRFASPSQFLQSLRDSDKMAAVLITHDGTGPEWAHSSEAFQALLQSIFPYQRFQFLYQEQAFPCRVMHERPEQVRATILCLGDMRAPRWPSLGIAIPTCNGTTAAHEALMTMAMHYPGELGAAIACNNASPEDECNILKTRQTLNGRLRSESFTENRGYGRGANRALEMLLVDGYDYYCVSNDDVLVPPGTLSELICLLHALQREGKNPGVIVPMSNNVNGSQFIDLGPMTDYQSMCWRASQLHHKEPLTVQQAIQVRGLFMVMSPECLQVVGGFDPRFGIGNCEDDDHNIRCRFAGFSLWIAKGAFLYHQGSQTFKRLKVDYEKLTLRNVQKLNEKWGAVEDGDGPFFVQEIPYGVPLHIPLDADIPPPYSVKIQGDEVDLVSEASAMEFVGWVYNRLKSADPKIRHRVISALSDPDEAA